MSPTLLDRTALLESSYNVKPLPASATRLAAIVAREDWEIEEIEEVITLDPALTARLLRAANSASNASNQRISTAHDAVVRLGPGAVVALSIAAGVSSQMRTALPEYGLGDDELWTHSVTTAFAAEMSRTVIATRVPPESFTAALLHDFGMLILAQFLDAATVSYMKEAQSHGADTMRAEWEILELHHGEIGGLVAQHWELPASMVQAIMYHHTPDEIESPVCDVVHFADLVAHAVHSMDDDDAVANYEQQIHANVNARLEVKAGGFRTLTEKVFDRFEDLQSRYR